ncbi:hypothetical protein Srot_2596 [Segniliparus rotundus DSM 44985]|uniref:Uncharacterized protein n=1 Tax=Segniliparus rotundus (strain ATCC BAA-972 / CDC 1076 / CIP 108378 / DSM 44985 / JCM 13578) TaxID=640132 RepID=D6ZC62_SEGRD|nr:hypothetical protein [Segniliparus rotundus]ADG99031.1 hypothetical protein Srot_2596 [Segniliparus rotundus DSM 44985]
MTYPPPPPPPNYPPPQYGPPQHPQPQNPPPKKSNKVLWVVLGAVGALLVCGGGLGFFLWSMLFSPKSGVQQVRAVTQEYRAAEDAKDAAKLAGILCSADAGEAAEIIEADQKVAPGPIDIKGAHVINSLGAVGFTDPKGQGWTVYLRKEADQWKVCPSAKDEFKAADTTTTTP